MTREFDLDETQEQLDFVQKHKKIPVTLTVSGYDRLIDLANAIENDDSGYWTNKKISSALRNISSIKPQPCEDAVSRKALISHIENQSREWGEDYDAQQILGDIEDLPSVKPQEPKTGHWIRKTKVDGVYDIAGVKTWGVKCQCDKCDFTTIVIEDFGYYKYCPNCGARMEVEKYVSDTNIGNMSQKPTGSKDVIWYSKRNYSEIVVEPQERSDKE